MTDISQPSTLSALLQQRQVYATGELQAERNLFDGGEWGTRIHSPKSIALECFDSKCAATMVWDMKSDVSLIGAQDVVRFYSLFYRCRHCLASWIRFEVSAEQVSATSIRATVHGIFPRQFPGISSTVIGALSEEETLLYLHAVQSRAAGMGLGALAYLRRVVEDAIDLLLDLLAEVLADSDDPKHQEYLKQVEWLKSQKAFDKKAVAAAAVLPKSFFAGGHNPFARLHDWASAGVHNAPDQECCDVFDEIRGLFDALFERLHAERETRRLYAERLGKLSKGVPSKATTTPE